MAQDMRRITDNIDSDPATAIAASRSLLESVCKTLLEELHQPVVDSEDLPVLYGRLAKALRLDPRAPDAKSIPMLRGLVSTVHGIAEVRNSLSAAHGKGSNRPRVLPRHARAAAGAAAAVCAFLIETADERRTVLD